MIRFWDFHRHHRRQKEIDLLREQIRLQKTDNRLEREEVDLLKQIRDQGKAKLKSVKVQFQEKEEPPMPPVVGPVVLDVGDHAVASLVGFDQQGNPMPADFVMPSVSFSIDDASIASSSPLDGQKSDIAGVSAGVANLTGSVQSAEGLSLTDTETVTVSAVAPPTPVLSSVKIAFEEGAPATPNARR